MFSALSWNLCLIRFPTRNEICSSCSEVLDAANVIRVFKFSVTLGTLNLPSFAELVWNSVLLPGCPRILQRNCNWIFNAFNFAVDVWYVASLVCTHSDVCQRPWMNISEVNRSFAWKSFLLSASIFYCFSFRASFLCLTISCRCLLCMYFSFRAVARLSSIKFSRDASSLLSSHSDILFFVYIMCDLCVSVVARGRSRISRSRWPNNSSQSLCFLVDLVATISEADISLKQPDGRWSATSLWSRSIHDLKTDEMRSLTIWSVECCFTSECHTSSLLM